MSHKCGSVAVLLGLSITAALYGEKKPDFSRFVVAGDSLSAGYQNSQLIESGQVHGYANVIATQADVSLHLPLLHFPGYPQISIDQNYAVVTGLSQTPFDALRNKPQTLDFAVPGFTVGALVGLPPFCNPDPLNPIAVMAAEILNPKCSTNPPTELEKAAALKPTTAILWIGSNDALFSILFGGPPTPLEDSATPGFRTLYHAAASKMASVSGHLVVANIPDVTRTAYLTSVPKLAAILGQSVLGVETVLGLQQDDMVTPYAFQAILAMGKSFTYLPDSAPPAPGASPVPIVIRKDTLSDIRDAVIAYNAVIAHEAADNRATLVDIYSLINDLAAHGAWVDGQKLTTGFMGGLFSLDGVHPTNTGYAIIANEFIKTMNSFLRTNIPLADVVKVSQHDPLIFPPIVQGASTGHVDVGMADALRHLHRQ